MFGVFQSLSGRLLALTVVFVMVAEVLIFVPSVAKERLAYFHERMEAAKIAAYALRGMAAMGSAQPSAGAFSPIDQGGDLGRVTPAVDMRNIVETANVEAIAIVREDGRVAPLLPWGMPMLAGDPIDLRDYETVASQFTMIFSAIRCLTYVDGDARLTLIDSLQGSDEIHVTISEAQVRAHIFAYGVNIFWLSLIISALTAALVYRALNRRLVKPMRRVLDSMAAFAADPEHAPILAPDRAGGEIGAAQKGLAALQRETRAALQQKSRLAALGEAVAKINHDLRNMLASASLVADRLEHSDDPKVRRMAPTLVRSLGRAVALCANTLAFGRAEEPTPQRRPLEAAPLLRQAVEGASERVRILIDAPEGVRVDADEEQLFRMVQNLVRNAAQAIETSEKGSEIRLVARRVGGGAEIDVSDDGPGLPQKALESLFKPFKGGVSKNGSGLGLAIVHELAQAHGGEARLLDSGPEGAAFRISIPDAKADRWAA